LVMILVILLGLVSLIRVSI